MGRRSPRPPPPRARRAAVRRSARGHACGESTQSDRARKYEVSDPQDLDSPYQMIGGRVVVERVAARFYEVMERDEPALAAVHRQAAGGGIDGEVKTRFALF